MIRISAVDAVLDTVVDDESPAGALVAMLDERGVWDWVSDDETGSNRGVKVACIESSGAHWAVLVRRSDQRAIRCTSSLEAHGYADAWCGA